MTVRKLYSLAAALGIGLAGTSAAQQAPRTPPAAPATAHVSNQQLANEVAAHLRQSGVARGADVTVVCGNGNVEITGRVRDAAQEQAILGTVLSMPGVDQVTDHMQVVPSSGVMPAGLEQPPAPLPLGGMPPGAMPPGAMPPGAMPGMPFGTQDPVPVAPPAPPAYDANAPQMPPFAWPTYSPYPNFSRVAYPQAYPYNAWPFIGPFYPFPKVPLGWRSV